MLPLTRSRNRARFFGIPFSPSALFEGGTVAGAWYDPSDLSTMFDTSAGTTPVAMPGQGAAVPVGLMLDKSQGLVLGSETVTNGGPGFTATTGWTAEGTNTVAVVGGELEITLNLALFNGIAGTNLTTVAGQWYRIVVTARRGTTASNFILRVDSASNDITFTSTNSTTVNYYFRASGTSAGIRFLTAASGGTGTFYVTSVSVKALPGNHAISFNNTTARPELRARVNLLTYSEEFDNGAWAKTNATITADAIANPLTGTVNADALFETTTNGAHAATQSVTTQAARFKYSVYLKANGRARFAIAGSSSFGGNLGSGVFFDLSTGQYVSGAASGATPSITDVGGGWWLVSYEWTANAATGVLGIYLVDSGTNISYAGDVTKGIYIWGADLRPANIGANVPAYQRIADANTYDTSGFPLYLYFDGTDDSMYTPANLNLSGTDKVAVFAGVRKINTNSTQIVTEFSQDINSNNGSFLLLVSNVANRGYTANSKGTIIAATPAFYAPTDFPETAVITTTADIAGDSITLRRNGIAATPSTDNQGTGNYGTYPLFIGARNNSSLWFNGHLHSLIIAGSAVSAGNISATEQWVAGKTGIQI